MKIPAILLSKKHLKKIAQDKLYKALTTIEENLEMAGVSERSAFEIRVAARFVKEDLGVADSTLHA